MTDDLVELVLGKLEKLGLVPGRIDRLETRLEDGLKQLSAKLDRLAITLVPKGESLDEFADIEPERHYTISELASLPGRKCSAAALYKAMDSKRLRENLSAGVRGTLGKHYIEFLRQRRGHRVGKRASKAG